MDLLNLRVVGCYFSWFLIMEFVGPFRSADMPPQLFPGTKANLRRVDTPTPTR